VGHFTNNGEIDTWFIHPDFLSNSSSSIVAGSDNVNYWQPIFSNTIHVKNLEFHVYPNKSTEYSWRDTSPTLQVAPYIRIKMILAPSWKVKRKIK